MIIQCHVFWKFWRIVFLQSWLCEHLSLIKERVSNFSSVLKQYNTVLQLPSSAEDFVLCEQLFANIGLLYRLIFDPRLKVKPQGVKLSCYISLALGTCELWRQNYNPSWENCYVNNFNPSANIRCQWDRQLLGSSRFWILSFSHGTIIKVYPCPTGTLHPLVSEHRIIIHTSMCEYPIRLQRWKSQWGHPLLGSSWLKISIFSPYMAFSGVMTCVQVKDSYRLPHGIPRTSLYILSNLISLALKL